MDKKIGKLVMLFVLSWAWLSYADSKLSLHVTDMQFDELVQVEEAEPFILQVIAQDLNIDQPQYIPGFENFQVSLAGTSQRTSTINGQTSHEMIFNYVLKIDKKGSYTIGPLSVDDNGQKHLSNKLDFTVGDKLKKPDSSKKLPILFRMKVDKKSYYKHEKMTIMLQLIFNKKLKNIQFFDAVSKSIYLDRSSMREVEKRTVELKGDLFYVKEFLIDAYPEEVGRLKINGFETTFIDGSAGQQQQFGGLFDFWGAQSLEKRMKSDPVWITALDLPEAPAGVVTHAIGSFSELLIHCHKKKVVTGKGVSLTVELYGDGNWHYIDTVPLDLPEGLRVYTAKTSLVQKNGQLGKRFDFVLQADKPGQYHVPAQKFHYLDPEKKVYTDVQSNSFDLHVLPQKVSEKSKKSDSEIQQESERDATTVEQGHEQQEKSFSVLTSPLHRRKTHMIPETIFLILLLGMLLFLLGLLAYRYIFLVFVVKTVFWQKKQSWHRALGKLKKAQKENDFSKLHSIFMGYFMSMNMTQVGFIRDYMIVEFLEKYGFDTKQVAAWKKFYATILQYSFAVDQHAGDPKCFEEAVQWLQKMKDIS